MDFTLTQEELADDVHWEELKTCSNEPTNRKNVASTQLPSRRYFILHTFITIENLTLVFDIFLVLHLTVQYH